MRKLALLLFALTTVAGAAKSDEFIGCTYRGVENCMFLKTSKGGLPIFVNPMNVPAEGRGVTMQGTIVNLPNICMAGPGIAVSSWSYNRLHCPKMAKH
jgi:hypothetical protein